mmetsp:Transcript_23586/g.69005  ORF Transcript_23586/g.69005 Transcript_23586/m.69005 type:complete len:94 (-) Transcript_23586:224-505(-)
MTTPGTSFAVLCGSCHFSSALSSSTKKSKKGAFQEAHEAIHAHQEWVEQTREYLRKMCVHEVVVQKTDSRALCPNTSPVDTQAANAQVPPPVR